MKLLMLLIFVGVFGISTHSFDELTDEEGYTIYSLVDSESELNKQFNNEFGEIVILQFAQKGGEHFLKVSSQNLESTTIIAITKNQAISQEVPQCECYASPARNPRNFGDPIWIKCNACD